MSLALYVLSTYTLLMNIDFRFKSKEARRHAAQAMRAAYGDTEAGVARLALNRWHFQSGWKGETLANAINEGPLGGEWRDAK